MIGHTNETHNEIPEKFNQVQVLLDPLRVRRPRGFATRPHSGQQRGEGLAARLQNHVTDEHEHARTEETAAMYVG